MDENNRKKSEFLRMNYGKASHRLRKMLLFQLVKQAKLDTCFRCGKKIKTVEELSMDHKKAWLGINALLFWDLDNIAWSHRDCNSGAGRRKQPSHGTTTMYKTHRCKCEICTKANTRAIRKYRLTHER